MKITPNIPFNINSDNSVRNSSALNNVRPETTENLSNTKRPNFINRDSVAPNNEAHKTNKILSTDEAKLFELLFPAGSKKISSSSGPLRSYNIQSSKTQNPKSLNRKVLGNNLDLIA